MGRDRGGLGRGALVPCLPVMPTHALTSLSPGHDAWGLRTGSKHGRWGTRDWGTCDGELGTRRKDALLGMGARMGWSGWGRGRLCVLTTVRRLHLYNDVMDPAVHLRHDPAVLRGGVAWGTRSGGVVEGPACSSGRGGMAWSSWPCCVALELAGPSITSPLAGNS